MSAGLLLFAFALAPPLPLRKIADSERVAVSSYVPSVRNAS